MKLHFFVIAILFLTSLTWAEDSAPNPSSLPCLLKAYPNLILGADKNSVVFPDGSSFIYDDGVAIDLRRDFDKLLANAKTLLSMFLIPYPTVYDHVPQFNEDPGRIRFENFFRKLYGNSASAIENDLVSVRWVDNTIQTFNPRYGAADALTQVVAELKKLVQAHPKFMAYLKSPLGGTFEWRPIAGTNNLSTHSFGIAIDINTDKTDYWRWDDPTGNNVHYKNQIPLEIVEIFEKHGFIWGGKWYHYDTMHFEYRPELLLNPAECSRGN